MNPVRYRILGPTQALNPDGTAAPVGGARLRALLTVLALRAGRTVPVPVLVREVWDGEPPADATGALQALVGRLRRALGAEAVVSAEGGYRLAAGADDVDLHRFERLTREGTRALDGGDPARAAAVLDEALALWRGPALADLPDGGAEAARWETRRLEARRARLTAALALGRAEETLPELAALCATHPLDEGLQALRLRALHAAGRTAQALAAYEDVRRLLADRLGSDPGPELTALHARLLRPGEPSRQPARAVPATPSPAADPSEDRTRPGDGAPAAARPSGNLPARLTSFVGREADIDAIRAALARSRLVTLTGPGGSGKTRLSQEAAEALDPAPRDGVWLAELAPVDDPAAVPEAVLTALGARETVLYGAGAEEMRAAVADRHDEPVARLVEHCARRRMLLLLDNCEHVVDAAARLVAELLARCPHLTVLATSREPLGVPGEVLYPVDPLPEPVALHLLADRGAAVRPGFRPDADPATAEACAEICRRLDGLPLAIELAAARLRLLTPRQIADRLDDRFRLLTAGSRTVLPRQQTLRAVVDWSWDLLDAPERQVLARLSVFAGGCDLAAAEAVCGPAALDALGSLVDKSLVMAAPGPDGAMRYRLLETVAEYAAERLAESGARDEAQRAHLTYYRELARTTEPLLRTHRQIEAIARLEREHENLRTALRYAVAARDEQEALCLVLSLVYHWQMRDMHGEARTWCTEVAALGPDPFAEPVRRAAPVWEPCIAAPPPLTGEVLQEARRGVHLACLAYAQYEPETWRTPGTRRRLEIISEVYEPGMPQTCRPPGLVWFIAAFMLGDADRMHAVLDACVRTCRSTPGFEWELANALRMRADLFANRADRADEAVRDAEEALEIYRRIGDAWGLAEAHAARAEAHERRGTYLAAAADYEAAIAHARRLGSDGQVAVLRTRLGSALLEAGGHEERGERLLREVIEDGSHTLQDVLPAARLFLAGWLSVRGRLAEAREHLRTLQEEYPLPQFVVFDNFVLGMAAWLDALDGRHEEALDKVRRVLREAQEPLSRTVAPQMSSVYLTVGAFALAGLDGGGRARDAARCLAAADGQLPPRHVPSAMERHVRDLAEQRIRAALGERAYRDAYAQGGGLSVGEAAALL
ncbi:MULTISPECIES: AfsR/SARP family transcriptional regulator [Streptomyces]|uniref:AfsR/SARP family transcriptional regulator n=1 Tax=Streptomyces TaxID=1883 RepID=UPI000F74AF10|nr:MULTISPECIES: BTAD domain-containing putative transcriptional regulator [Streptomyces]RSS08367.1 AfsR/SARP family transcriptional regulator [Streptomyces sp. WAC00469]WTD49467.1 AAA family ATPase [Streptomyces thermoviolaceus]